MGPTAPASQRSLGCSRAKSSPHIGIINVTGLEGPVSDPATAERAGILLMHQEPIVVDDFTVGENVWLADRFAKAAEIWRQSIESKVGRGTRSPGTLETYERTLKLHVLPALGEVRLLEISPPLLDRFLKRVLDSAGGPTAKLCRSVISGALGLAVRYGALATNPVRDADRLTARPPKEPRALTLEERQLLLKKLDADPVACAASVPELVRFMLGTGQRIGECLGVLWLDVDLGRRRVEVSSTVIRWTGHGLVRKETKTRAGRRTLVLLGAGRSATTLGPRREARRSCVLGLTRRSSRPQEHPSGRSCGAGPRGLRLGHLAQL